MNKRSTALIALAGFGLGVFVGKGLAEFGTAGTTDAREADCRHGGDAAPDMRALQSAVSATQ